MSSVHPDRGDEDERRCVWVAEDDYIRLKKDYDAATKATFDAIQTITQLRDGYAALVQQGIRDHGDWRSKLNFLEADYKAEIARLRAENERLRKAGDAMADDLRDCQADEDNKLLVDWLAAKEGGAK